MTTETKEKSTRTPRDFAAIEKGSLSLELKDRVALRNSLTLSIDNELQEMKERLASAEQIVKGEL